MLGRQPRGRGLLGPVPGRGRPRGRPLSRRRAESVVGYLAGVGGVDRARLQAAGYGERRPVASNDSETGRALNRRVEFTVLNPEAATRETVRETPAPDAGDGPATDDGRTDDDLRQLIRDEIERLRDDSR